MDQELKCIFLDVGNTLRLVVEDPEFQAQARKMLVDLVEVDAEPNEFIEMLEGRYQVLRKRAKTELVEASEEEMWTEWMLPEFPKELIAPNSGRLTRLWRDSDGRRVARPDVKETVIELHKRGYTLGIIANTITETEIPDWLEEDGLTDYFKTVILSSKTGTRKPGPEIYWEAAKQAGFAPAECVYVGDNPSRDIQGTRLAGYGMMIIIREPATLKKEPLKAAKFEPDATIDNLIELLDYFPPLQR